MVPGHFVETSFSQLNKSIWSTSSFSCSFSRKIRTIEQAPICLSLEEVAEHAGHEVLVKVGDHISLIVGNRQGILDQKLRPRPIQFLNPAIIILLHLVEYPSLKQHNKV